MKSTRQPLSPARHGLRVFIVLLVLLSTLGGSTPGLSTQGLSAASAHSGSPASIPVPTHQPDPTDLLQPGSIPVAVSPDPLVQEMINQVHQDQLYFDLSGLSGEFPVTIGGSPYTLATRYSRSTTAMQKATQYVYERLSFLGLNVQYQDYSLPSVGTRRNVMAEQMGLTEPQRIFLITAHLDDTSQSPNIVAPGADDNGSGSVAVLAAADILSQYSFGCTLRYVLFTGEEQGLYGSYAYAGHSRSLGENIEAVINLDMISFNSNELPILDLHARTAIPESINLAHLFQDVVSAYRLNLIPDVLIDVGTGNYSDNKSFWDFDYPAILAIEDDDDFNPFYHQTLDVVENINPAYYTEFVKASIGTLAHLGCLMEGQLDGVVASAGSGESLANATVEAQKSSSQSWTVSSGASGLYSLTLPPGAYTVTASAPSYVSFTVDNLEIANGQSAHLSFSLQPCVAIQDLGFTYTPQNPVVGQQVTFTANAPGGSTQPVEYSWNFGDGSSAVGAQVSHTFAQGDLFHVSLSASNCGGTLSASQDITVGTAPAISLTPGLAAASLSPGESAARMLVVNNTGSAPLSWILVEAPPVPWLDESVTSGTTGPSASSTVTLTFTAPTGSQVYTTTLQIDSNDPNLPRWNVPITLTVPCAVITAVDFSALPLRPVFGLPVTFFANLQGGTASVEYTWDFGDNTTPTGGLGYAAIDHIFTLPTPLGDEDYPVKLTVANECTLPLSVTRTLTVHPLQIFLPFIALPGL